ncbi:MAG: hypothetical protein MAG551_01454 [Candidatus Scalindua arabica]|uniref:Uncharacterized protein n=1 Tax=Candidatus Scalindua arabica TaxID=1127984 RepID=A0A941W2J3_9BACT|nr:hypothetical protein [Candidatus Scalindua arabica]
MIKLEINDDQKGKVMDVVKSAISAEVRRMEIGLKKTNAQIEKLEKKYNTSSGIFLRDFRAEDLKDGDREYVQWTGELKIRERIMDELNKLKDIEYVAH